MLMAWSRPADPKVSDSTDEFRLLKQQPHKLIYSLICPQIMLAFKIVHRRGADRTPHCLALIKHREINDHPIEVVAQYFPSL
jgi:hypothetical protein